MLHARPLDVPGRVAQALNAALVGIQACLALWLQEALADMIVGTGALQILGTAQRVSIVNSLAAARLHRLCFASPLLKPCVIITYAFFESQSDSIDLPDFRSAPWRHVEPDQEAMRPAIVFRKIRKGQFFLVAHARTSQKCREDTSVAVPPAVTQRWQQAATSSMPVAALS